MRPSAKWNVPTKTIMVALTLAFVAATLADPVTEADVKKMTTGWLNAWPNRGGLKLSKNVKEVVPVKDDDGNVLFYGVQLDPEGYVLTTVDDQLAPIVAFNDKGQFAEVQKDAPNAKRFEGNPLISMTKNMTAGGLNAVWKLRENMRKGASCDRKQALKMAKNQTRWADLRARAKDAPKNPKQAYANFVDSLNIRVPIQMQVAWSQGAVGNKACYNYYTPSAWREPDKAYRQNSAVWHGCYYNDGKAQPIQWNIGLNSPMIAADTGPFAYIPLDAFPAKIQEGVATNMVCGCTAVAKAQIVRHWAHNKTGGVGKNEYVMKVASTYTVFNPVPPPYLAGAQIMRPLRGGDGQGGPYDFSKMPLKPEAETITDEECRQIGALMVDCGLTNGVIYSLAGTAGVPCHFGEFGFVVAGGKALSISCLRACLDAGYPCLMDYGREVPGSVTADLDPYPLLVGHSFNCDGYAYLPDRPDANGSPGNWFYHCNLGGGVVGNVWYSYEASDILDNATLTLPPLTMMVGALIAPEDHLNSLGQNISVSDAALTGRVLGTEMNPSSVDVNSLDVFPMEGVSVTARSDDGAEATVTTNARGIYAFILPMEKNYTLTAKKAGYDFAAIPENPLTLDGCVSERNHIARVSALTTTRGAFDIAWTDAIFKGAITAVGAYAISDRGFCWGAKLNPTVADNKLSLGTGGVGDFSAKLSDYGFALTPGTTYHVRAYVTTTNGISYGGDDQFRTND